MRRARRRQQHPRRLPEFRPVVVRAEGAPLGWLPAARGALLAVGILWSGWLGMRLIFDRAPNLQRAVLALPGLSLALSVAAAAWILVFWLW